MSQGEAYTPCITAHSIFLLNSLLISLCYITTCNNVSEKRQKLTPACLKSENTAQAWSEQKGQMMVNQQHAPGRAS